jgi:ankyrin repeat protein
MFLNARATVLKKIERAAKEKELEERALIKAEKRRQREALEEERRLRREEKAQERERLEKETAILAKEERERRRAEAAAAKHRPPVMEMVRNLELSGSVPVVSDTQRVRRSMVHPQTGAALACNGHISTAASSLSKKDTPKKKSDVLEEYLMQFRQIVKSKRKRDADSDASSGNEESNAVSTSQLYMNLYDYLSSGGHVTSASVKFAVEWCLPTAVLRMLLSRYAPNEMFRTPFGKTLIHIAAESNNHIAIPLIISHWEKRQEALRMLMRSVDLLAAKDFHKRTAVHSACEKGSYRALVALHKLGCGLEDRDIGGYTPLLWCACKDSPECAAFLMKQGVDGNVEVRFSTISPTHVIINANCRTKKDDPPSTMPWPLVVLCWARRSFAAAAG